MLRHSKLRSWLTIIGIVIGVGAVVGIVSLGDAMQAQMQSRLASMDLSSITPYRLDTQELSLKGPDLATEEAPRLMSNLQITISTLSEV